MQVHFASLSKPPNKTAHHVTGQIAEKKIDPPSDLIMPQLASRMDEKNKPHESMASDKYHVFILWLL